MKNNSLTLSIVIPVYNEERYLKACLESIARQSLKPAEVILVDNNSQDKTVKVAKNYQFTKVLYEAMQGVQFAEVKGFDAAKGVIICRIDGDTILPSDWLEKIATIFEDRGIAAVTGPVNYYDMPFPHHNFWTDHIMRKLTYVFAPRNPFLYGSNMAFRRDAWRLVSKEICRDHNIHGDVDIAIHLFNQGQKILYTKKLLAKASGRRYNDDPRDFIKYVFMYQRVYKQHNLPTWAAYPGIFMWTLGFVLIHPWRKLWYKLHGVFFRNYPFSDKPRKNPMAD